ncbi:[LysW]-aminoadipate/[LysW]-glutamate kinase [Candidatus Bathyarchaeota archaeon]|nr:[LysW]-aminoadipate/[LysW]-glutamate kinase [Candidatus Bathyarchaeota archaeon]
MAVVVKIGGTALRQGFTENLVDDLNKVYQSSRLVLVHGGGIEVTETAGKLGKEQRFVVSPGGMRSRYTDKETAEIFVMVMAGKINKSLVAKLQSGGVNALGLSGADGGILRAQRKKRLVVIDERGRKRAIEGGYTGKIIEVNTRLLDILLSNHYLPVIAPIALGEEYELLNVDADRAGASIAGGLKAEKWIVLTDVPGLLLKGKVVPRLSRREAEEMIPNIGHGMMRKIHAAVEALDLGANEVIITSGLVKDPVSSALSGGKGTVVTS